MPDFKNPQNFDQIEPDMKEWPVYLQAKHRSEFVHTLNRRIYNQIINDSRYNLKELINKCAYNEIVRIKKNPWNVDPPNEILFWKRVQKDLNHAAKYDSDLSIEKYKEILRKIINRYSEEIVGSFKIPTFNFARKFTHVLFSTLFNQAVKNFIPRFYLSKKQIERNVRLYGYVEEVRKLYDNDCIVVVLPTHISNLDSPLIGYMLEFRAGLPAFNYAAGLNLFNSEIAAYFMNRLGAYRVDRRKKNKIYLEALTSYSEYAIEDGVNSLFFPGGTRSRSGKIEEKLKLGLLSTLFDAQRELLKKREKKKIIIVPMMVSMHFTLEANALIDQHLRFTGREKYLRNKPKKRSFLDFFRLIYKFHTSRSEAIGSFGQPIDVFGNSVNEKGVSLDKMNKPIDISEYFISNDRITKDDQRESVYTNELSQKIVDIYYRDNIILSSQALAYICFKYWFKNAHQEDLYKFIQSPIDELYITYEKLVNMVRRFNRVLKQLENDNILKLSDKFDLDEADFIEYALNNLGLYHKDKTLKLHNRKKIIITENIRLLYYYHNRIDSYDLDNYEKEWID